MVLRRLSALAALSLFVSLQDPHLAAQFMPRGGATGSGWRVLAPNVEVAFEQVNPNSCTWRFRNTDTVRTLVSMRFNYTYSTLPVTASRNGTPDLQTGEDVLPAPLDAEETAGGPDVYRIQANCATVNIHVVDSKWI